jgi:hypothetical protein
MAIDFKPQFDFQPEASQESPKPQETSMGDVAKQALQSGLSASPEFNKPLSLAEDASPMGAIKGGAQAALETLKDPTRLSATSQQPGDIAGEAVKEKTGSSVAGFATKMALDPMTWTFGAEINPKSLIEAAKEKASGLKDSIINLFKTPATEEELASATKNVQDAMVKARSSIGKKLGEMRGTDEKALDRLSDIAEKGTNPEMTPQEVAKMHKDYFSSRAPEMEEAGMQVPPEMKPKIEVYNKGTMGGGISPNTGKPMPKVTIWGVKGDPAEVAKLGFGENPGSIPEDVLKQHGLLPDVSVKGPQFGSPKEEIQHLLKMRQGMYDQISKKTLDQSGNIVKAVSGDDERAFQAGIKQINDKIAKLPGGEAIRAQEQKFSQIAGIYDDLQSKLSEPNKAQAFLKRIFTNPTGVNKDYIHKIAQADELTGGNLLEQLQEAFQSTKGLTYEQLKHPVASVVRAALPETGNLVRGAAKVLPRAASLGRGIQTPFNTPDMQSLRDRLNAQQ